MIPAPMPVPIFTTITLSWPTAMPDRHSPRARRLTSLSTQTGAAWRATKRSRTGYPSQPGMIGGDTGRPLRNSTGPGIPMPMPHSRPGRSRVAVVSSVNSSSTRWRQASGPAAMSDGSSRWPRMRPSRSVIATSMLVAPRSATRTCPASARKVIWRGGRPPVLGPISSSTTSPSSMSSATRWATMPRLRPVRATSSARDRDRAWRISSRIETSASSASPPTSAVLSRFTSPRS